jgi:sugar phosphate isomerase/epimerase
MAQKLLVYQSLWAMERRSPDGHEWSLQEKLHMIRDAGFDGAGVRFADRDYAREVTQFLKQNGMSWQAQAYPQTVDDLKPILEHILEFGADHLNVQPDVRPYTVQECIPLIEGWHELADAAGVRMHIETHRNRMTTDLFFMLHLLDAMPNLRLTGDLSHYVVGREFWYPISAEDDAMMQRIINNCWGFHGRVASREQIQLQISFHA